ncbi:hypothetical protein F5884DRAFT_745770 [Xylogone sp. PMI_703]|nr:hypothetical protein F5884DRAFT_745770 [Xylogone sp. PMI_703]
MFTGFFQTTPCEPLEETATFEVLNELSVGDGLQRGGSQVFTYIRNSNKDQPLVAKVYDPLYYPFTDYDYPYIPNDVVATAEHHFALESAAYSHLDERLGGGLIPKFYGSWILNIPLKHQNRPVRFILLEYVKGVPLSALDPNAHTQEERLNVLALSMEACLELFFADVAHNDIAPRNVICSTRNFLAEDLRVRIIDFNVATIYPLFGYDPPYKSQKSPKSPLEIFWMCWPGALEDWVPQEWVTQDERHDWRRAYLSPFWIADVLETSPEKQEEAGDPDRHNRASQCSQTSWSSPDRAIRLVRSGSRSWMPQNYVSSCLSLIDFVFGDGSVRLCDRSSLTGCSVPALFWAMDPLTAISLASCVVQFVSFAREVCSLIKQYSGSSNAPKEILEQILLVDYKLEALSRIITSSSDRTLSKEEEAVIGQCIKHAQELKTYLSKFQLYEPKFSSGGKKLKWLSRRSWQKTSLAVRVKWGKEALSDFQRRVDQLLDVIQLQGQSRIELQLDQMIETQKQIHTESSKGKKRWCEVFFKDRGFKEDHSFVESKISLDAAGDDISIFMQQFDETSSYLMKEVEYFCNGASLADLKLGHGTAGHRRGAWIDDSGGYARKYQNPLCAAEIYQTLKIPQFDNGSLPDANRRLIYIENLDPYYIIALGHTAPFHQISALKEAIWTHIAFKACMRVKIPATGFPTFRLEFHIPYFALRTSPSSDESFTALNQGKQLRQWRDITFLEAGGENAKDSRVSRLCEAQFSLVICGSDNWRWTGHAFSDTYFNNQSLTDYTFSYDGLHEDPIASNGELDANLPLWDPREYFLMIIKIGWLKY